MVVTAALQHTLNSREKRRATNNAGRSQGSRIGAEAPPILKRSTSQKSEPFQFQALDFWEHSLDWSSVYARLKGNLRRRQEYIKQSRTTQTVDIDSCTLMVMHDSYGDSQRIR